MEKIKAYHKVNGELILKEFDSVKEAIEVIFEGKVAQRFSSCYNGDICCEYGENRFYLSIQKKTSYLAFIPRNLHPKNVSCLEDLKELIELENKSEAIFHNSTACKILQTTPKRKSDVDGEPHTVSEKIKEPVTPKISFWTRIKSFFSRKKNIELSENEEDFTKINSNDFGSYELQDSDHKVLNFESVAQLEKKAALQSKKAL